MEMELSEYELNVVAQAMRELLIDRLFYGVILPRAATFQSKADFAMFQRVINAAVNVYGRTTMMSTPDATEDVKDEYIKEWLDNITLSHETWEIIDKVTLGSSWDDVPTHTWHKRGCPICTDMQSVAVGMYS